MSMTPPSQDPNNKQAPRSYPVPAETDGTTPPTSAPVTTNAGRAAETFITEEVAEAKRSLMITRIASALLSIFVVVYLGIITKRFQDSMQPANAAEIAHGIVVEKVDDGANSLADEVKRRVPALIEQAPDYAIKQMPLYRERLENQVLGDISGYASQNAPKLGEHLDDFLNAHKDEVKQMLDDGQNPAVTDAVGEQLEQEFLASLKDTDAGGGESYREKMDKSLAALTDIKKKMDHLASNKGLTPAEKKTRRAIAILASKITEQTVAPAVAPVKAAASSATNAINSAAENNTPAEEPASATTAAAPSPEASASAAAAPSASPSASPAAMPSPAPTVR